MPFFGNIFTAEIVARIFYNADIETRAEIINTNPPESSERDRVSVLCREIRRRVNRNPFIRSISIQAHGRDTTQRDALFVFRYKNEVKVGIFEGKLLRINDADALTDEWDWKKAGTTLSHFTQQVINQQTWVPQAAVWDMFIPNCAVGQHAPSLERRGSSNIWATNLITHPNIASPNTLWNYQHVISATQQYLSMYEIIKEILRCNQGARMDIVDNSTVQMKSTNGRNMDIPLPNVRGTIGPRLKTFFEGFSNICSYNYYRFDDLEAFVTAFIEKKTASVPDWVKRKKMYSSESHNAFVKLIQETVNQHQ